MGLLLELIQALIEECEQYDVEHDCACCPYLP